MQKSTERTERRYWGRFDVFLFKCKQISDVTFLFPFLTLNKKKKTVWFNSNRFGISWQCLSLKVFTYVKIFIKVLKVWNVRIKTITDSIFSVSTTWKVSKYGVYFDPHFPVFGLNTEFYSVNLRIQFKYRKTRTRINSVLGYFSRSVVLSLLLLFYSWHPSECIFFSSSSLLSIMI